MGSTIHCKPGKPRDQAYLHVAGAGDHWQEFCQPIGSSDIVGGPRLTACSKRHQNQVAMFPAIEESYTIKRFRHEAMKFFNKIENTRGAALDTGYLIKDERLKRCGAFLDVPHPRHSSFVNVGRPIKFSRSSVEVKQSPLGEPTEPVLTALLGYCDEESNRLRQKNAI